MEEYTEDEVALLESSFLRDSTLHVWVLRSLFMNQELKTMVEVRSLP